MISALLQELRKRYPRVAVVHDWLTIPGGSEQVVMELLEMFPTAELFTSIYDPSAWPSIITERPVHYSSLQRLPGATHHYPKLLPLMNHAFRAFDLSSFDLVLSSNHACAKNVRTPPRVLHVCYCHTPMRYAWEEGFLEGEQVGATMRLAMKPLLARLRRQDLVGSRGPDMFVANSRHVAGRIERYYGRGAEVVHPPVDVERFLELARAPRDSRDYYLVFGRVVPYKRVDLAVQACLRLGRKLKVAGDGRALEAVRELARGGQQDGGASEGSERAEAIEFLGRVEEEHRDRLLAGARALLFPGEEDFGIVPVEAQAAGVPVVAYGVGGARETVQDGRTGVLYEEGGAGGLAAAMERFEGLELEEALIRENARGFGRARFREEMAAAIERAARVKQGKSRVQERVAAAEAH
jgi:glycosyltransferase involved in cell wall biosynthesis